MEIHLDTTVGEPLTEYEKFLIVFALMTLGEQRDEEGDRAGVYEVSALLSKLRAASLQ